MAAVYTGMPSNNQFTHDLPVEVIGGSVVPVAHPPLKGAEADALLPVSDPEIVYRDVAPEDVEGVGTLYRDTLQQKLLERANYSLKSNLLTFKYYLINFSLYIIHRVIK